MILLSDQKQNIAYIISEIKWKKAFIFGNNWAIIHSSTMCVPIKMSHVSHVNIPSERHMDILNWIAIDILSNALSSVTVQLCILYAVVRLSGTIQSAVENECDHSSQTENWNDNFVWIICVYSFQVSKLKWI